MLIIIIIGKKFQVMLDIDSDLFLLNLIYNLYFKILNIF